MYTDFSRFIAVTNLIQMTRRLNITPAVPHLLVLTTYLAKQTLLITSGLQ